MRRLYKLLRSRSLCGNPSPQLSLAWKVVLQVPSVRFHVSGREGSLTVIEKPFAYPKNSYGRREAAFSLVVFWSWCPLFFGLKENLHFGGPSKTCGGRAGGSPQ